MFNEAMRRWCEGVLARYETACAATREGTNYRHISGNLATAVKGDLYVQHEDAARGALWLDIYHDLLEAHPAFRTAEVETEKGMFPDAPIGSVEYVMYSLLTLERRLDEPPFGKRLAL